MHRVWRALPWVVMAAAWGVAAWACHGDASPDKDDVLTGFAALAATVWALLDHYSRRGSRERAAMTAGALERDAVVAAEGVAAWIRQEQSGNGERQDPPVSPRPPAGGDGRPRLRPSPGPPGATSGRTPPAAPH